MPRTVRASCGSACYHVMNRGNGRAAVYLDSADYSHFLELMRRACARIPMRVLAWCLMPNHFHMVLRPHEDGDLGRWMHWLLTSQVQRHRRRHDTTGRIWQGRFLAPPIQQDRHLLTVIRYVERNPLRAKLVDRAEKWRWSSLSVRIAGDETLLHPSPVELPTDWVELVNEPLHAAELEAVRMSLRRGRPYGDDAWVRGTAERMGLLGTLRPPGRPRIVRRGNADDPSPRSA